ncbi:MAG: asparagine synthetase B, partial [Pseudomonadota bacterium]
MCGICGVISQELALPQLEAVARMNSAMIHRGPDGEGKFRDSHIAMAMRRLSIIDLDGGWQPLYNETRDLVLVANGEIYNFIELREELRVRGHRFHTASDCETILHLYEDHGEDCVQYLRGMFAFALWDSRRGCLFIARDRMGEKPLYIFETSNELFYASEMKALLASGFVPNDLDPEAIDLFF